MTDVITVAPPIEADVLRLRHEYVSMPGLRLTVAQTARLLSVRRDRAGELLESLARDGFLIRTADGMYRRRMPLAA